MMLFPLSCWIYEDLLGMEFEERFSMAEIDWIGELFGVILAILLKNLKKHLRIIVIAPTGRRLETTPVTIR